jgi:hypothetical protein
MKKICIGLLSISVVVGNMACKAKKCASFSDPKNNSHVNYNKKGLVKSKNKRTRSWTDKY